MTMKIKPRRREDRELKAARFKRYRLKKPPEWNVWKGMKQRCYNSAHKKFDYYGGSGITVCERWRMHQTGFKNFLRDMGPRPADDYDLSRLDHNLPYCPTNCIWEPRRINRNVNGDH